MFIYYLLKKKKALRGHLFPRYKSEFTISPLNFLDTICKPLCICIISIFSENTEMEQDLAGSSLDNKSPSVSSSISCLWKKKACLLGIPKFQKYRLKQLMIRTQQSQDF